MFNNYFTIISYIPRNSVQDVQDNGPPEALFPRQIFSTFSATTAPTTQAVIATKFKG